MSSLEKDIQQSRFYSEHHKANINVLYTANWLYNKISAQLKPFGLTHEQFNVLRILRGKHPECMCQKDILNRMIAPSSNLTLIIKKLVQKGLVTVEQSARDKREYEIHITQPGLAKLGELDQAFASRKEPIHLLEESEAQQLNVLLDKMRG